MDDSATTPNSIGQPPPSVSTCASTGSSLALVIAFNHLKKRLAKREAELTKLKMDNKNTNSEVPDSCTSTLILERKVEQLQRSLQSKITAYNNLEATYKQTRENEEALIEHSSKTEEMLDEVMVRAGRYQKESEELKEEMDVMTLKFSQLEKEKEQLEDELHDVKNIPEVSVMKNVPDNVTTIKRLSQDSISPLTSQSDVTEGQNHLKQIEALLYENKTLRTNMYWLATELKTVKTKKELSPRRARCDSDSLEEGRSRPKIQKEKETDKTSCNVKRLLTHIRYLQNTISTLREALDKNTVIINDILFKKTGKVPKVKNRYSLLSSKLEESYVTIMNGEDTIVPDTDNKLDHVIQWETDEEMYKLPELESASVIVPLDEIILSEEDDDVGLESSGELFSCRKQQPPFGQFEIETYDPLEFDPLNRSYPEDISKKRQCICTLPLSLVHNLELQKTQTYLKSKTTATNLNSKKRYTNYSEQETKITTPRGSPCSPENRNIDEFFNPARSDTALGKLR